MTDTREFLAAVADRLPLLDLAREYMELRRVGRSFRGRCPIHGGQGLSFDISPARNLFHCFAASCEAGGDIAEFAMRRASRTHGTNFTPRFGPGKRPVSL